MSSIRENAGRERGLCLAGFQKRIWLSEKQLLNLRCHGITMVQATESRKGLNVSFTRRANFCRPTCWRVLRESEMRPVLLIIEQVGRHQPFEMPLIQDDHVVPPSRVGNFPPRRSATPFCHGLRKAVRVGRLSLTAESTSAPNFASRSSSKNLCKWKAWGCRMSWVKKTTSAFRIIIWRYTPHHRGSTWPASLPAASGIAIVARMNVARGRR
jgi:hypothetical protein